LFLYIFPSTSRSPKGLSGFFLQFSSPLKFI
jgi:hypothetical protein